MFHKIKHITNIKFKQGLVKRARDYIESQDKNRVWEDDLRSRNRISSTEVSRLTTISTNRNEILNKQREASQAIAQLNMEYQVLSRDFEKRDRQIKEDRNDREKLDIIKEKRKEQENHIKGYTIRRKELDKIEQQVKDSDEYYNNLQFNEQLAKEKEDHILHLRSLNRQS
jgi:hypothetical protein